MKTSRKTPLLLLAALPFTMFAAGLITKYNVSAPVRISLPAMSDSTNLQGEKFELGRLLDSKGTINMEKLSAKTAETDTAGLLTLATPQEGVAMQALQTRIRSDRFATGNLKVTSPAAFKVLVNDKMLKQKKEVQDSVDDRSTVFIPMTLQPQANYEVIIQTITDRPADIKAEFVPDEKYADAEILQAPDLKKRVSIETTEMGLVCTRASISPDGAYMLVSYRDKADSQHSSTYSELWSTEKMQVVNSNLGTNLSWMPEGHKLYYTEENRDTYDLFVTEVPSMKTTKIADGLPNNSFHWAPNEKFILYYDEKRDEPAPGPIRRIEVPDDRIPGNRDRFNIVKHDLATGISAPITFGKETAYIQDISADSRKMLYTTQTTQPSKFPFYFISLVQMDLNTLRTDTLVKCEPFISNAVYSPDAKQVLVTGGPAAFGGIGLQLPEGVMPNDYDNQAFILDIATGNKRAMTMNFDPSVYGFMTWNRADGQIYFIGEAGFDCKLFCMNPVSGAITQLPTSIPNVHQYYMGKNEKRWISYIGSDFDKIREPYLLNLSTRRSTPICPPIAEQMEQYEMGDVQVWTFQASDGTTIDGRCILPPDFDPDKKYPLIVYYYGGTSPTSSRLNSPYAPHLFASRGYVVYTLNPSGSTGYGQEFSARHVNAWGKRTSDDIIEGTKEFCRQHPFVNDKKIGCIGASYGGFMTQYLLTLTDIFAAGVSHAGISNVTSYWGEGFWGYSYNTVAAAQSYPWNNPDLFTKQGSLFNADKIHTPLLLLHGTADNNVPIGESVQLFNALKILGREVEFITVDGEDHYISNYDKRVLWHDTTMAWFAKWLQDNPSWWDSLYGK